MSFLKGQKLVENAMIQKFKCDIFKHCAVYTRKNLGATLQQVHTYVPNPMVFNN